VQATANDCRTGCTSGSRGEHWSDSCMPEQSWDSCMPEQSWDSCMPEQSWDNCTRARSSDSFAWEGSSDIPERTLDIGVKRQSR